MRLVLLSACLLVTNFWSYSADASADGLENLNRVSVMDAGIDLLSWELIRAEQLLPENERSLSLPQGSGLRTTLESRIEALKTDAEKKAEKAKKEREGIENEKNDKIALEDIQRLIQSINDGAEPLTETQTAELLGRLRAQNDGTPNASTADTLKQSSLDELSGVIGQFDGKTESLKFKVPESAKSAIRDGYIRSIAGGDVDKLEDLRTKAAQDPKPFDEALKSPENLAIAIANTPSDKLGEQQWAELSGALRMQSAIERGEGFAVSLLPEIQQLKRIGRNEPRFVIEAPNQPRFSPQSSISKPLTQNDQQIPRTQLRNIANRTPRAAGGGSCGGSCSAGNGAQGSGGGHRVGGGAGQQLQQGFFPNQGSFGGSGGSSIVIPGPLPGQAKLSSAQLSQLNRVLNKGDSFEDGRKSLFMVTSYDSQPDALCQISAFSKQPIGNDEVSGLPLCAYQMGTAAHCVTEESSGRFFTAVRIPALGQVVVTKREVDPSGGDGAMMTVEAECKNIPIVDVAAAFPGDGEAIILDTKHQAIIGQADQRLRDRSGVLTNVRHPANNGIDIEGGDSGGIVRNSRGEGIGFVSSQLVGEGTDQLGITASNDTLNFIRTYMGLSPISIGIASSFQASH